MILLTTHPLLMKQWSNTRKPQKIIKCVQRIIRERKIILYKRIILGAVQTSDNQSPKLYHESRSVRHAQKCLSDAFVLYVIKMISTTNTPLCANGALAPVGPHSPEGDDHLSTCQSRSAMLFTALLCVANLLCFHLYNTDPWSSSHIGKDQAERDLIAHTILLTYLLKKCI